MLKRLGLVTLMLCVGFSFAAEGTKDQSDAIIAATKNYLEGWFQSDPAKMDKGLHDNLTKWIVEKARNSDKEYLRGMTKEYLVTLAADNQESVKNRSYREIKILFQNEKYAMVHATADGFYDLCNLAKINGEWRIVQVLWDRN